MQSLRALAVNEKLFMKKLDKSIRNITLAAIKRSLMKDSVCKFTRMYDTETMTDIPVNENVISEELPIACTYVDKHNYTLITTRRIITRSNGSNFIISFQDIKTYKFGDFKAMRDNPVTLGSVTSNDGENIPVLIESGKPSIIAVNAIGTILNLIEEVAS